MNNLSNDVRYAARKLAKSPGFTVLAVLTLGLGIGLNSAVFSVVNAVLFKPLPVTEPGRLANVYTAEDGGFITHAPMSFPDYEDLAEQSRAFSDLAAYTFTTLALEIDGDNELVMGELASGNFFSTLGLDAALGRTFTAADDRPGDPQPVAVLSHLAWQRRFGADPGVVGQTIHVNGHPFTVIGVAPEGFHSVTRGISPELWVPMRMTPVIQASSGMNAGDPTPGLDRLEDRARRWHWTLGRLAPGITLDEAKAEMSTLTGRLQETYPTTNEERVFALVPTRQVVILPGADRAFYAGSFVVMGLVTLVLLIACANLANMLLARAMTRRKEIATRLALGAGRGLLVRQLLIESLGLAFLGGVLGLVIAGASSHGLKSLILSVPSVALEIGLDVRVVVFTIVMSTLTAVVFGLAPAFEATRANLASALHEEGRGGSGGRGKRRVRGALVVGEVALSLLLLICAGLSVRSMQNAHRIDPGFDADGVVVARFAPQLQGYDEPRTEQLYRDLEERLAAMPGVKAVGMASHLPLTLNVSMDSATPEEMASLPVDEWTAVDRADVGPGYFEAMGISLLRGRGFEERDTADSLGVVVINETLAKTFWPDAEAVGQRLRLNDSDEPFEVIGVARDGKYRTLGESPVPFAYGALAQDFTGSQTLVVRTAGDPQAAQASIRQAARELDEALAIDGLGSLDNAISVALVIPRVGAALFGIFGVIGMLLAAIGLYGVISYMVSQRTREIGVRLAMGARRGDILRLVVREGLVLTLGGIVLGLVAAAGITRVLEAVLYGVSATDAVTFGAVALFLTAVALVASLVPARRASTVDPLVALRYE